jgi:hypothetical protein
MRVNEGLTETIHRLMTFLTGEPGLPFKESHPFEVIDYDLRTESDKLDSVAMFHD